MLPKARGYLKPSFCNLFANLAHVPGSASWRPVGAESNLIFCICLNHLEAVEVCGIVQDPTQSGTVQSWPTSLVENVPGLLFEELLDSPHNDCTTVELVGTTLPHLSFIAIHRFTEGKTVDGFCPQQPTYSVFQSYER